MIAWQDRAPEVSNLLNPAFCATVLYSAAKEYEKKNPAGMPYTLIYLVLPIVLHKKTRERINSVSNMIAWLYNNSDALIGYSTRAKNLVPITNEAVEFLFAQSTINIIDNRILIATKISGKKLNEYKQSDTEIRECLNKAEHVARWFTKMNSEENIYSAWGVKP